MKEILEKISSYNIFNYMLPGVVFVLIAKSISGYNFIQSDGLLGVFLYYFIGMIISRIGSLFIEPVLKKIKFLKFSDYKKYVAASSKDSKIELFSEVNNTYRTLVSMTLLLLLLKLYNNIAATLQYDNTISIIVLTVLIFVLSLFSYRKQTNYITKRIDLTQQ